MNYEILNVFNPSHPTWKEQKSRLERAHGTLITLAPDPGLLQKMNDNIQIINVIDYVTGRTMNPQNFMFFNQAPVVDGAEILMVQNGKIDVIKDGTIIGSVNTYNNSRRLVNNVTYLNADGTKSFVEEYAYDGKLFSRLFYNDDEVQQIVFYNDEEEVVLTYYFYLGQINLITVENSKNQQVVERYDNQKDFFAAKVAEIVGSDDKVGIMYLGMELFALSQTKSNNTLYLVEPPLDNGGKIRQNLALILQDKIKFVHHVVGTREDGEQIKKVNFSTDKLIIK